jgi:hypothetical protein
MNDLQDVLERVQQYFDGIYRGEVALLRDVFHPDAVVFDNTKGAIRGRPVEEYIDGVANRQSPQAAGEAFDMKVLSVDVLGELTSVTARLKMLGNDYHNLLSLLYADGRWSIVSKLFVNAGS